MEIPIHVLRSVEPLILNLYIGTSVIVFWYVIYYYCVLTYILMRRHIVYGAY